nr:reverse transcriptase domain-containing protein [Tanacetum cinerariifolium]
MFAVYVMKADNVAIVVKEQKYVSNNDHVACEKKVEEVKNFKGACSYHILKLRLDNDFKDNLFELKNDVGKDLPNLAMGICYHLKDLRCSAQCLIEDEDFVNRLSNHYKEPTEQEIQEMVNILVFEEEYEKMFNHLDMLHALFEGNLRHWKAWIRSLIYEEIDMVQNDEALEINLDILEERREQAAIHEARSKEKMEKYYNSKVRNTSFKPRDLVYQNNNASHAKDSRKLCPKWEGSYEMVDYSLWEVIENGNAPPITQVVEGVNTTIAPTPAEEKARR